MKLRNQLLGMKKRKNKLLADCSDLLHSTPSLSYNMELLYLIKKKLVTFH